MAIVVGMAVPAFWQSSEEAAHSLTVYCAHDATFAEAVIDAGLARDLERVSAAGIPVDVVFEQGADVLGLK